MSTPRTRGIARRTRHPTSSKVETIAFRCRVIGLTVSAVESLFPDSSEGAEPDVHFRRVPLDEPVLSPATLAGTAQSRPPYPFRHAA